MTCAAKVSGASRAVAIRRGREEGGGLWERKKEDLKGAEFTVHAREIRSGQVRSGQVRTGQVRSGQVRARIVLRRATGGSH
jgi:hypothetical protein